MIKEVIDNIKQKIPFRGEAVLDKNEEDKIKNQNQNVFDVKVMVQPTPNPNAFKFIVNREVKARGKVTYAGPDEVNNNPLAKALFAVDGVEQLHFFENVITVTFTPAADYYATEDRVIALIKDLVPNHDPQFQVEGDEDERRAQLSPELQQIEEILDRTIRPGLQGDGGDIEVINKDGNELFIRYQGACGSCPSATMGTLMAIQGVLRDEFDPDIDVIPM